MSTNALFVRRNQVFGIPALMSLSENVTKIRKLRRMSQQELADKVGVRQNTIAAIESGGTSKTRYLHDIAKALEVDPSDLDPRLRAEGNKTFTEPSQLAVGERNLPVHSSTEGGSGFLIVSSDPVDYTQRPERLQGVRDGYAILVAGDSMFPAFEVGDTVLVHPHLPPVADADVVLYSDNGHGEVRSTIKRLLRVSPTEWHLQQWNPKREFKLSRKEWQQCHRVIGKYSRR